MAIDTIEDKELEIIVATYLKDKKLTEYEDCLNAFFGGIVLKEGSEIIIQPQCCGDISDITKWETIGEMNSRNWKQLWIGHPWVYVKKQNADIEFTEYTEDDKEMEELKIQYKASQEIIVEEFQKARKILIDFQQRIYQILKKKNIENALEIAKIITGTND
ncbi:hypothetical protein U8527_14995 [Kordia algicida OT-1]|uniref:Uncharacterized protein n=1 Tax=Kordia algicida OT-1 TaxID=391587 RepID=A9E6Y3_9FLAO|nr:hypothetical protein [Kordia algicida]EDP94858.1 hypothetical protein KAOT1_08594 [Kordia algicida OT-1]